MSGIFIALVMISISCLFFTQTANAFSIVTTISVGSTPFDIAYDSGKGEMFVANRGSGDISVIDDATNTVVATINTGTTPQGATYDSEKGEIFITNVNNHNVSVIDDNTNTVVATINVGVGPHGVAYDPVKDE